MNPFSFKISLRFFHPSADPENMIVLVGLKPRFAWKARAERKNKDSLLLGGTYSSSYCTFEIAEGSDGKLSEALSLAVQQLEEPRERLTAFRNDGGSLEIFVGWFSEGMSGETPSQLLGKLHNLGIDLLIDVYGGS
jgi:hypothetical protein